MSYQEVTSGIVYGVMGQLIHVEVELQHGLPYFAMVGYLSKEAQEARERVASAFRSIGHPLPSKKITVNLSPANIRKRGTAFDFPIAVAFLAALQLIPSQELQQICILGELGLNGQIRGVGQCLPIVLEAKKAGIRRFFVAKEDEPTLGLVHDVEIVYMSTLEDVISYFRGELKPKKSLPIIPKQRTYTEDFGDLYGQDHLKRAIEIALIGRFHLLIVGSPGSGKTMAIKRIPSVLGPLNDQEHLEVQSIYDASGIMRDFHDYSPPFRAPHPTLTRAALLGGGQIPKAGEVSLAHHGILFLDEFLDYKAETIEVLKTVLDNHIVRITRNGKITEMPADIQLIATANPCPCGHGLEDGQCSCTFNQKRRYLRKLPGSLLDRFDMILTITEADEKLYDKTSTITSKDLADRIARCQSNAFKEQFLASPISHESIKILDEAFSSNQISRRGVHKLIDLGRAIATIEHSPKVEKIHILEAMSFRNTNFIKEVLQG